MSMGDVPDKGSGRFHCQRCGWCCQNQLIRVFMIEIRAIIDLLNRKSREDFEDHITACLAYEGNLDSYDYNFKRRLDRLLNFFEPYEIEVFEGETTLVKTHVITLLPETMRCVFYNPLSPSCFIYPARPLTCRMFPYEVRENSLVMVDEADKCPGVGIGEAVNLSRHRRLSMMCQRLLHQEDQVFWEFAQRQGLMKKQAAKSHSLISKRLIDPFVKLGLVPEPSRNKMH